MAKQYGLILPGDKKKPAALPIAPRAGTRPSIFDESSESDDDTGPQLTMKASKTAIGPSAMERRMARSVQQKALAEDPTVYQYDELYDEMESRREQEEKTTSSEPKKPKYIGRLMQFAERRKLEGELRVERQVQKEREKEGEEFKDKDSFVTSAYRKKLEELRVMEEQEKRDEYLESVGDVTKQKDLDGFYRHLYEQKLGTTKPVAKEEGPTTSAGEDVAYKPIKSGQAAQPRAYRQRRVSADDDEAVAEAAPPTQKASNKTHLQNNIDADSDFSIDSSSDDDDAGGEDKKITTNGGKADEKLQAKSPTMPSANDDAPAGQNMDVKNAPPDEIVGPPSVKVESLTEDCETTEIVVAKPKVDKTEIWRKRTVGEAFDKALQRYFERKALRQA